MQISSNQILKVELKGCFFFFLPSIFVWQLLFQLVFKFVYALLHTDYFLLLISKHRHACVQIVLRHERMTFKRFEFRQVIHTQCPRRSVSLVNCTFL